MMPGQWDYQKMPECELPGDAASAFSKTVGSYVGVSYTPVLYVAKQAVSGTNYCFVCKTVTVSNPPAEGCKAVFVYMDLKGNSSVTHIYDIID